MSKSLYALGFMAMCCVILVIHEQTDHEEAKLNSDPFLASVEARVVAVAQKRLKKHLAEDAASKHISEARKAIKAALLDADADNQLHIKKFHAEEALLHEEAAPMASPAAPKKAAGEVAVVNGKKVKQFTWAQMQAGDDAMAKSQKQATEDTHALMHSLLAAPKIDGDEAATEGANMVTAAIPEEAPRKATKAVKEVAAATEDSIEAEAPPAVEAVVEAPKAAVKKVVKAIKAKKVAKKVLLATKKVAAKAAKKTSTKKVVKKTTKKVADKATAVEPSAPKSELEADPVADEDMDGYTDDDPDYSKDDDDDYNF